MNVEDAFKKSVEYLKDVLEFLDKVKEKKLRKDKEDLIVALRVFLEKTRSLIVPDSSNNDRQEEYDDVEPVNKPTDDAGEVYVDTATNQDDDGVYEDNEQVAIDYDDVVVNPQSGNKSSPSRNATIIPPTPCDQLKNATIADYLDIKREKSLVKGAWVKRWCVIHGNVFYMYETSKDKKQKDAFELNGFNVIVRDDITKETKRKDRCFELKNIQTNKVHDFCAMEKNSVELWKQCFEKASLIASSDQGRRSLPKVATLPPSPSQGSKLKNLAGGMMTPLKTMMRKTTEQDSRAANAGVDGEDVYVDTEGDVPEQLPIYDDTEMLDNADEGEATYDDVGDTTAPDRKLPVTPDMSNRTMPRPPKASPLPETPSSNQRPLPSERNKFSFEGTPHAPPRPKKDNQNATSFPPTKNVDRESGSGTFRKSSLLPPTPEKGSSPSLPPSPGNLGRKKSVETPFDQKDDEAKYKDVKATDLYQGMWDCYASDRNELSFKRGQLVHIVNKDYDNHGWWVAKRDGDFGLVPKEYLMEAYEK